MREELRTISEYLETLYEVDPILRTTKSQVTSTDDGIHLISQLPTASRLRCKFDFWAPPSPPEIPDHEDGIPVRSRLLTDQRFRKGVLRLPGALS